MRRKKSNSQLSQDGLQCHFNPPASAHFGEAWERLVRPTKRALKAIAGKQRDTDETLLTFMAEAESLINSRPLSTLSSDCKDREALTPNHFLLNLPMEVVSDSDLYSSKRCKHAQVMTNPGVPAVYHNQTQVAL